MEHVGVKKYFKYCVMAIVMMVSNMSLLSALVSSDFSLHELEKNKYGLSENWDRYTEALKNINNNQQQRGFDSLEILAQERFSPAQFYLAKSLRPQFQDRIECFFLESALAGHPAAFLELSKFYFNKGDLFAGYQFAAWIDQKKHNGEECSREEKEYLENLDKSLQQEGKDLYYELARYYQNDNQEDRAWSCLQQSAQKKYPKGLLSYGQECVRNNDCAKGLLALHEALVLDPSLASKKIAFYKRKQAQFPADYNSAFNVYHGLLMVREKDKAAGGNKKITLPEETAHDDLPLFNTIYHDSIYQSLVAKSDQDKLFIADYECRALCHGWCSDKGEKLFSILDKCPSCKISCGIIKKLLPLPILDDNKKKKLMEMGKKILTGKMYDSFCSGLLEYYSSNHVSHNVGMRSTVESYLADSLAIHNKLKGNAKEFVSLLVKAEENSSTLLSLLLLKMFPLFPAYLDNKISYLEKISPLETVRPEISSLLLSLYVQRDKEGDCKKAVNLLDTIDWQLHCPVVNMECLKEKASRDGFSAFLYLAILCNAPGVPDTIENIVASYSLTECESFSPELLNYLKNSLKKLCLATTIPLSVYFLEHFFDKKNEPMIEEFLSIVVKIIEKNMDGYSLDENALERLEFLLNTNETFSLTAQGIPVLIEWYKKAHGVDGATLDDFIERLAACKAQQKDSPFYHLYKQACNYRALYYYARGDMPLARDFFLKKGVSGYYQAADTFYREGNIKEGNELLIKAADAGCNDSMFALVTYGPSPLEELQLQKYKKALIAFADQQPEEIKEGIMHFYDKNYQAALESFTVHKDNKIACGYRALLPLQYNKEALSDLSHYITFFADNYVHDNVTNKHEKFIYKKALQELEKNVSLTSYSQLECIIESYKILLNHYLSLYRSCPIEEDKDKLLILCEKIKNTKILYNDKNTEPLFDNFFDIISSTYQQLKGTLREKEAEYYRWFFCTAFERGKFEKEEKGLDEVKKYVDEMLSYLENKDLFKDNCALFFAKKATEIKGKSVTHRTLRDKYTQIAASYHGENYYLKTINILKKLTIMGSVKDGLSELEEHAKIDLSKNPDYQRYQRKINKFLGLLYLEGGLSSGIVDEWVPLSFAISTARDITKAIDYLKRAVILEPDDGEATLSLIKACIASNDSLHWDEAKYYLSQLSSQQSSDFNVRLRELQIQLALKMDDNSALETLEVCPEIRKCYELCALLSSEVKNDKKYEYLEDMINEIKREGKNSKYVGLFNEKIMSILGNDPVDPKIKSLITDYKNFVFTALQKSMFNNDNLRSLFTQNLDEIERCRLRYNCDKLFFNDSEYALFMFYYFSLEAKRGKELCSMKDLLNYCDRALEKVDDLAAHHLLIIKFFFETKRVDDWSIYTNKLIEIYKKYYRKEKFIDDVLLVGINLRIKKRVDQKTAANFEENIDLILEKGKKQKISKKQFEEKWEESLLEGLKSLKNRTLKV